MTRGRKGDGIPETPPERGSPTWYLNKHKTTKRPVPCERCGQNAYYDHKDFGMLCAPHLLDLVNIGGSAFSWNDYPEMWERTERLLARPKPSTTVKNTDVVQPNPADKPKKSDG